MVILICGSRIFNEVYKLVKRIPRGRVATYGQIAAILGKATCRSLSGLGLPSTKA